ncbi:uncharacterized protein LOC114544868, partial [Dendronephthya gigantea]|uniref:uncharacterized protein LOC114544868 n=1 Tax=Dendronephthya gigantea TaxID=151771 RepID=UPI00106D4243
MFDEGEARSLMQRHAAKFLLCSKTRGMLTQSAVDLVKDSAKNLLTEYLDIVKKSLVEKINSNPGQELQFDQDVEKLFSAESVFDGVDSEYQQRSYFKRHFNLVALLQNPDVLKEVENPHFSCDGVLRDVMDGDFFKSHPVFSLHSDALQLLGYYDDLEIANPLGSKAKIHKIGVFYFVLGNIRPMFRSSIRSIQLIAIAKTKDIKSFGIDNLLMPFIEDVNCLAKVFLLYALQYCDLLLWTGDTLGSNYVSGFKEGVGGALRICRHCMGTRLETNNKFLSEDFSERDLDNHRQICACIEDEDNALNIREQLSTTYGVNRLSVLDKVQHFDVCICIPEDIMHIFLDGLVPYETKLMLKYLIDESRCITLKELNRRIENFDYGYMNKKNKPTATNRETINGVTEAKLKQSASQMWCLFRFLPIMIGDKVDEQLENWHCLLKLWNIVQICTSPGITKADAAYLKVMINDHHKMFKNLYPNASIIPKMHYLIHIPDEIVRFGPPRNIWTMRFEAKHSFLKSSITKNFKNVPNHLHFPIKECEHVLEPSEFSKQPLTNYLYSGDVVGLGDHNVDLHSYPYFGMIAQAASVDQLAQPCKGS